jgi:type II secretory pathway component PulF
MTRWLKNIFLAIITALLAIGVARECLVGDLFGDFTPWSWIDPSFVIAVLLLGSTCTVVIWAFGFTRLNAARAEQRSTAVLGYLEQTISLNLPLTKMLRAAQASEPRWIGRRIGILRDQLDSGGGIANSLRVALPDLSARKLGLLQSAEKMGRLGPELTRLLRSDQFRQPNDLSHRSFLRSYPVAMTIAVVFVVSILMTFVMPKYQQIFRDFRVSLPPLTQLLVQWTADPLQWLALAIIGLTIVLIAPPLWRRLRWSGPFGFFTANRDWADICHVLCEQLQAGQPLPTGIRAAADLSIRHALQLKLQTWASGIEAGQRSADAARAAELPELLAGLTTSAEGFEFLSRYYAGKFSRAMILIRAAGLPLMTLFFGLIVAFVALSLFLPMVKLINSVAPASTYSSWL